MTRLVKEIPWPLKQIISCEGCASLYKLESDDKQYSFLTYENAYTLKENCWRFSSSKEYSFESICPNCGFINETFPEQKPVVPKFEDYY
jgi:rRNA maturation protein Nop10